ncbi:hypothetical protein [Brevundimonas sp.]|uniref:hypothetical protein n=1 Tax=Brevundimonas sp. TaxID=1871086 RepID=UPI002ED92424
MPTERILHYRRARARLEDGGYTLFCIVTGNGELAPALAFRRPDQCPDFAGEEAWFRVRWFSRRKFEVIEQVSDRTGARLAEVDHGAQ